MDKLPEREKENPRGSFIGSLKRGNRQGKADHDRGTADDRHGIPAKPDPRTAQPSSLAGADSLLGASSYP